MDEDVTRFLEWVMAYYVQDPTPGQQFLWLRSATEVLRGEGSWKSLVGEILQRTLSSCAPWHRQEQIEKFEFAIALMREDG